ncbi:MAG TPA: DUF6498-containing protein [Woeseiaceae bacterium]|nr:DUF6498-containing protein [Woeseiaceae bacterium]
MPDKFGSSAEPDASPVSVVHRFGIGAISLIVANTLLLYLFFWHDATLFQLVLVYWCECAWIGVFSAIKLIVASIAGDPYENGWVEFSSGTSLFTSVLVIGFAGGAFLSLLGIMLMSILFVNDALPLGNAADDMHNHISLIIGASLLLMAAHAISLVVNYLVAGEYKTAKAGALLLLPFSRCVALLFAIIVSVLFVVLLPAIANTTVFACIVIAIKVSWDIRLHRNERRMLGDPGSGRAATG